MYYKTTYICGKVREIFRSYTKNIYNKKGPGRERSPDEIAKDNQRRREQKLTRILNANFCEEDSFITLTYPKNESPELKESIKQLRRFLRKLKKEYSKGGYELKYVYTTEIGKKGAVHHHLVINGIENRNTNRIIKSLWGRGTINIKPLDSSGQYKKLAEYLLKDARGEGENKKLQSYGRSRNLIVPSPKVEKIHAKKWKEEPKIPKGYILEPESLYNGINPFTGGLIQRYSIIRVMRN